MFGRTKIAALVAEFVGTFTLSSVVLAMLGRTTFPFFTATAAGVALVALTLAFGSVGYYNPAITIAAWTVRRLDTARAIVFLAVQLLGGVVAWTLNQWLLNTSLKNIANSTFDWRLFTAEAVGAFVFAMVLASAAYQAYVGLRHAVTVGLGLGLGMLVASFAGNGLINPAVAIGVQSFSFIYAAAPVLGALVGMNLYALLFVAPVPRTAVAKVASKTSSAKAAVKKPVRKTVKK